MKIKLNLENFQNITLEAPSESGKDMQYAIILHQLRDWIDYTPHAKPLYDHIRSILEKEEGKGEISGESNVHGSSDKETFSGSHGTDSKPLPVIAEVDPLVEEQVFFMPNLKNCTVIEESPSGLAYKLVKEGCYVYLAKSHIEEDALPLSMGVLLPDIPIKSDRKWILGKDKNGHPKLEWKAMGGGS